MRYTDTLHASRFTRHVVQLIASAECGVIHTRYLSKGIPHTADRIPKAAREHPRCSTLQACRLRNACGSRGLDVPGPGFFAWPARQSTTDGSRDPPTVYFFWTRYSLARRFWVCLKGVKRPSGHGVRGRSRGRAREFPSRIFTLGKFDVPEDNTLNRLHFRPRPRAPAATPTASAASLR